MTIEPMANSPVSPPPWGLPIGGVGGPGDASSDLPWDQTAPFLRIASEPGHEPLVHIGALAATGLRVSESLLTRLNEINALLRFARILWVDGQVIVESEVPSSSLSFDGLRRTYETVCAAAGCFGPVLMEEFDTRRGPCAPRRDGTPKSVPWDGYL